MIQFKNVTKRYKKPKVLALNSLTVDIQDNEVVCLLGPNGAGKTTLIKCLTGLILPDSGEIYIQDENILLTKNMYMKDVAVVLEGARNLYWRATVRSNFHYFAALKGKKAIEVNENIDKYSKLFGIDEILNRQVNTLSLGQKQKVAIVSSILLEPRILILDEPSNGLDIDSKDMLIKMLEKIKKQLNTTILIASHDSDFIRKIVDRVMIIHSGEVKKILINDNITNTLIEEEYLKIVSS